MNDIQKREDALFEHISKLIDEAHNHVRTTINTVMVYTYYGVGRYIVEDEQHGEKRAAYGKSILKNLSKRLSDKYDTGWSVPTLKKCRYFYTVYSPQIGSTPQTQLKRGNSVDPINGIIKANERLADWDNGKRFTLSWSHYLVLMRIENPDERNFYENVCNRTGVYDNCNANMRQVFMSVLLLAVTRTR